MHRRDTIFNLLMDAELVSFTQLSKTFLPFPFQFALLFVLANNPKP